MVYGPLSFLKCVFTGNLEQFQRSLREERGKRSDLEGIVQPELSPKEVAKAEKTIAPEHPGPVIDETPAGTRSATALSDSQLKASDSDQTPNDSQRNVQSDPPTKSKVVEMSYDDYKAPIRSEYAQKLSKMSSSELYDNYNPGPSNPDGTVNFECHCVGHLVASPCGAQFRRAITCQRAAGEEGMERGECADEFMDFMRCAIETNCFRAIDNGDDGTAAPPAGDKGSSPAAEK